MLVEYNIHETTDAFQVLFTVVVFDTKYKNIVMPGGALIPGYVIAHVHRRCRSDNIVNKTNGEKKTASAVAARPDSDVQRYIYIIIHYFKRLYAYILYTYIMRCSNNIIATARIPIHIQRRCVERRMRNGFFFIVITIFFFTFIFSSFIHNPKCQLSIRSQI